MNKLLNLKEVQPLCTLLSKIPLIMRISIVLLFVFAFHMNAEHSYSQSEKISLDIKNSSIEKVLQTIEEKSDYYFLYSNRLIDVDRTVSVNVENAAISSVLNRLFASNEVEYDVKGSQIILSPKEIANITAELQENTKTITGTIVDSYGEPIIGANIIETGTNNGTVTDFDGNFSLTVQDDAVLHISYIGYLAHEITTTGRTRLDVVLLEDTQSLDELVVVGYGVQKKKLITGATVQVSGDNITKLSTSSALSELQGQAPGVNITQSSGMPGEGFKVNIRGIGTVGDSSPLYVIDGIAGGDINSLNPSDIESIDVLKDAASAAIYGARAANGVVLVTTKKGRKNEKVSINVNGYYGWQNLTRFPKLANAGQYVRGLAEAAQNRGEDPNNLYTPEELAKWQAGTEPGYKSYDYYDMVMRKNVPQYHINANEIGRAHV